MTNSAKELQDFLYAELTEKTKPLWEEFHKVARAFDASWKPMHGAYSDCYWAACGAAWEKLEAARKPLIEVYEAKLSKRSVKAYKYIY